MTEAPDTTGPSSAGAAAPDGAIVRELTIVNKKGLHARASAKFVQTVERFDCRGHGDPRQ